MSQDITTQQLLEQSNAQFHAGQFEQALSTSQRILQLNINHPMGWNNAAAALAAMGRWLDAYAYAQRAFVLSPEPLEIVNNYAHILAANRQVLEAGAVLRNKGWQLHLAKESDLAMGLYEAAVQLNPRDVEAWHVIAGMHSERKNKTKALELMNHTLSLDPHHLTTLAAKGNLLGCELNRFEEAEACFHLALSIAPNHWMTLYNYGVFLAGQERYAQAIAMYDRAGLADPHHHLSFWNLSNLLLRLGDYTRAWPLYEWRWQTDHLKPAYLQLPMPLWTGQDLQGKRILLHFEQGYGDGFQFIRFAKNVADRGAHVSIFMPREICDNFKGVAGVHQIFPWNEVPQGFDYHAPLMSLPAPLGLTTDSIPNQIPYLFALPGHLQKWQSLLPALDGTKKKFRVGLAWCGRPTHDNDRNRSMAFADFLPLITAFPSIEFVSIQVGPRDADLPVLNVCQEIVRIEHHIKDFSDTAAIAMQLDLLLSVDTSVVHLTAALGKPVWVLIPAASDWRWLQDESSTQHGTPWYPNVRLFRQSKQDGKTWNWAAVLKRIELALAQEAT